MSLQIALNPPSSSTKYLSLEELFKFLVYSSIYRGWIGSSLHSCLFTSLTLVTLKLSKNTSVRQGTETKAFLTDSPFPPPSLLRNTLDPSRESG